VQTASTTLAAAIAAAEQQPVHTVTVDWDSDGINSTANMIADPDFELGTGLTSWSGYVPGGGFLANTTFRDVASGASIPETGGVAPTAQSGSKMRFVAFGAPGSTGGMHGIRLVTTVGQQYTATFRVQIPTSPASGTVLRLRAWDKGALVADSTTTSTTASWVTLTVTWLPTSQYTWIGIYATGTAAAQVYAFIDNVSVTVTGTALTIDTLTDQVDSVTIDRTLTSDLPDAAQLVTGYAAAEATIVVGDVTPNTGLASAAAQYSPYNPASPLYGKQEFAPIAVQLGHRSTAGVETLPAFVGQVREIQSEADGTITISALDGAEKMRGPATLPVVVADDLTAVGDPNGVRPGLNSQWLVDWLARQGGFYASPPPRAKCTFSATLHGSAMPEVGYPQNVSWDRPFGTPSTSLSAPFRQGKFGLALDSLAAATNDFLYLSYRPDPAWAITLNNGTTALFECWLYADAARLNLNATDGIQINLVGVLTGGGSPQLTLGVVTGKLTAVLTRGTVNSAYVGPTIPADNAWHYAAIQTTISANGSTVDIQYRLDGSTTTRTALAAGGSITNNAALQKVEVGGNRYLPIEAAQITAEDSTAQWNDSFVATAVLDAGLNQLVATPVVSTNTDRWQLLTDIVAAEYGTVMFDELGRLIFHNAEYNRRNSTVVQVMTSRANMLAATVDRAKDQIRNHITATVKAPSIATAVDVFTPVAIPALPTGQTVTIITELDKPTFGVSGPLWLQPAPNFAGLTISSCIANTAQDGSGSLITSGVTVYANVYNGTTVRLDCMNTNNFLVYLVFPVGSTVYPPTSPGLILRGHPIDWSTTSDTPIDIQDAASIAQYGEQGYDVPSSDWLQQASTVTGVLNTLLATVRKPHPILTNLQVVEDCRLQLADRVQLVDTDTGLILGEEYVVTGIRTERSDSGAEQSLTVRQLTSPGGWVLGRAGRMKLGTQTRLL
jgi:hypothetical protein